MCTTNQLGCVQVPLPPDVKALDWLRSQPLDPQLLPRSYFSSREPRGDGSSEFADLDKNIVRSGAGIGSAVLFKGQKPFTLQDWKTLRRCLSSLPSDSVTYQIAVRCLCSRCPARFVSPESPLVRAYGGLRFNSDTDPSTEWKDFGSFYFFIPQVRQVYPHVPSFLSETRTTYRKRVPWLTTFVLVRLSFLSAKLAHS